MQKNGGLDPAALTPTASLNRVRFTELAGLTMPADMVGKTAYELLSSRALAELTLEYADALGLAGLEATDPASVAQRLDQAIAEGTPSARAAADAVAQRFGERIGWLLVTLRLGDPASRLARPDWDDSYWRRWAGVSKVYLGGGVAGGRIGPQMVEHASRTLAVAGMSDCSVRIAEWPSLLPLVGAGRTASPNTEAMVVLDFGQTFVKRGVARYEGGSLTKLAVMPRLPSYVIDVHGPSGASNADIRDLGQQIVKTVAETWRTAQAIEGRVSSDLVVSLASYMRDGQPLARQGGMYAALLELSDNLAAWISDELSALLRRSMTVSLLHDCSAAALSLAGEPDSAVIMLGTALGAGYPAAVSTGRPLAPQFVVSDIGAPGREAS